MTTGLAAREHIVGLLDEYNESTDSFVNDDVF
jgi:hypothetical protein